MFAKVGLGRLARSHRPDSARRHDPRIDDDDFTAVAPAPRESEAGRIKAALMAICGRLDAAS